MADEPLLTNEEVASVLEREETPTEPEEQEDPGGTEVFSLRHPVAIARQELAEARSRCEQWVEVLTRTINDDLQCQAAISLQGFRQEQVKTAIASIPDPAWVISLVRSNGGGIALVLDGSCGLGFVEMALGGPGAAGEAGRAATPLEQRVLDQLATSLSKTLSRMATTGFDRGAFSSGLPVPELASGGQTVGVGLIGLAIGENEKNGLVLITPDLLRPAAKAKPGSTPLNLGPLVSRVRGVPMRVRPILRTGLTPIEDLVALEPGAVLQFELEASSPLTLRVNDRDVFRGKIERTDNRAKFAVEWRRGRRLKPR